MTGTAFEDLGFARVDLDRVRRRGHPEAIFCQGKTPREVVSIAASLVGAGGVNVLATRASRATLDALRAAFPDARICERARLAVLSPATVPRTGRVAVVAWRPEDEPVAEEAALVADAMGSHVERRFAAPLDDPARMPGWTAGLGDPGAVIVADGTGGALASVVAGLVRCVVVALPTSAGGAMPGSAALLSALNSCSPGVVVVNIDNGYGAGYAAHLVNMGTAR
ncbi:MAG TPA: nickel pincer cofactor biosynthesis protein LarB [Thermomonospora sp.]|nr:nickel pincer cofactor biosynthesis protein LarB [Thermomonospora sp.]